MWSMSRPGTVSEAKVSAVCKTVSLGSGQGE